MADMMRMAETNVRAGEISGPDEVVVCGSRVVVVGCSPEQRNE